MNIEQQLQGFRQKYIQLEHQAEQGSIERHVYGQIVTFIQSQDQIKPALQQAFQTQIALVSLAKELDPPSERSVVWGAVKELEHIANLQPLR